MTFSLPCQLLVRSRPGAYCLRQKWIPPHWVTESYLNEYRYRHLCIIATHLNCIAITMYLHIGKRNANLYPNNNNCVFAHITQQMLSLLRYWRASIHASDGEFRKLD
jgi:hypothetical protein